MIGAYTIGEYGNVTCCVTPESGGGRPSLAYELSDSRGGGCMGC